MPEPRRMLPQPPVARWHGYDKGGGVSSGDYGRELYEAHMASMEEPITSEDRLWMNGYRRGFLAAIMEMYETGTEIHTSSKGGKT